MKPNTRRVDTDGRLGVTSVASIFRDQSEQRRDAVAIRGRHATVTYGELDHRANQVASGLAAVGVGAGDRVAILDKNSMTWFEVLGGAAKLDAVMVSLNWRLAVAELAHIVDDSCAKVLVVGAEFAPVVDEIVSRSVTVVLTLVDGPHSVGEQYEVWRGRHDDVDPRRPVDADAVVLQLYTSGTTGLPKGAMISNANLACMINGTAQEWAFTPSSNTLLTMPLFHIAGSGWGLIALAAGSPITLLAEVDPDEILDAIEQHRITHAFLVPAVIQILLLHPACATTDVSSLEVIVYGASPIAADVLVNALRVFACGFYQTYGLSETTGPITTLRPADHDPTRPALLRSCGQPFPWVEVRIVGGDSGVDVDVGEVGEIWTRSAMTMVGYWNLPAETATAIDGDGWFKTGDAGFVNEDGFVFIHDRVKDMLISGGENVYPAEVENVLFSHPAVADVAVIGVPSPRWGETPKAIVVRRAGEHVGEDELISFARSRLAKYKCPTSVDFVDVLPRNPSGKVLKRELRQPYWESVGRQL